MTEAWPVTNIEVETSSEKSMTRIFDIVRVIRNIRAESKVPPSELRDIHIVPPSIYLSEIEANASLVTGMTRSGNIVIGEKPGKGTGFAYGVIHGIDIYVDASIDESKIDEERNRLSEQITMKREYLRTLTAKLKNNAFVSNAPEKVVRIEMEKKNQVQLELSKLEEKYTSIGGE